MKSLPVCSPSESEQKDVFFGILIRIFVMYSIPEGNNVALTEKKIVRGQTGPMALNDIGNSKEFLNTGLCEK